MPRVPHSAIHPEFFLEYRDISDFVDQFGPFAGRYVAPFPPDWTLAFQRHLDMLTPIERTRAVNRLDQVRSALAARRGTPAVQADEPWPAIVTRLTREGRSFQHVVGNALDPGPGKTWTDALDAIRDSRPGHRLIRGAVEDYVEEVEPLLERGPSAYLVDPYFDVLGKQLPVLRALIQRMLGSRCYELHVVVRYDKALALPCRRKQRFEIFSAAVKELYQDALAPDRALHVHLIEYNGNEPNCLDLHRRYFLSHAGGLEFDKGFHVPHQLPTNPQMTVTLVSRDLHPKLMETYERGVAGFGTNKKRLSGHIYPWGVKTIDVNSSRKK